MQLFQPFSHCKRFSLLLCSSAVTLSAASPQPFLSQIGYVDFDKVCHVLPEWKDLDKEGKRLQMDMQELQLKMQHDYQAMSGQPAAVQQRLMQRMQQTYEVKGQVLTKRQKNLDDKKATLQLKVKEEIDRVRQAKNYTLILYKNHIAAMDSAFFADHDITETVKQQLQLN